MPGVRPAAGTGTADVLTDGAVTFAQVGADLARLLVTPTADAAQGQTDSSLGYARQGADEADRYRDPAVAWSAGFAAYAQTAPERCAREGTAGLEEALDLACTLRCRSVSLAQGTADAA